MAKNCLVFITVLIGQSEGLPNITGNSGMGGDNYYSNYSTKGAFFRPPENDSYETHSDSSESRLGFLCFDASKGETKTDGTLKTDDEHKVYGSSNHVTPFNATIKVWQRVS